MRPLPVRAAFALAALVLVVTLAPGVRPAFAAAPTPGERPDTTRVSYLAGASVYLEAGRDRGLAVGDTVSLLREGKLLGRLRVTEASSRRSVCEALPGAESPRVGDRVLFRRRSEGEIAASAATGASADSTAAGRSGVPPGSAAFEGVDPMPRPALSRRPVRGRVAAGFLNVEGEGTSYSRPTLDLRLEGRTAWGAPLDFLLDVRGYRLVRGGESHGAARVYRLSVASDGGAGTRHASAGRQSLPFASGPALFDGVSFALTHPGWTAGAFSGFEPRAGGLDFDSELLWTGVYAGRRGRAGAREWSATLGALDVHDHGVPSRAALFLQASYRDRVLSLLAAETVDRNGSWKQDRGASSLSFTSTLLTARARVTRRLSLHGGYDGRRNVLVARDRETPVTAFDDRFREGAWSGFSVEPGWSTRVDGSARWTSGGAAGTAWVWTGALERRSIPLLDATLALRTSRVESRIETGWLHAATASARAGGSIQLSLSGGLRETREPFTETVRQSAWEGLDADIGWGGRWYALLAAQREHGDEGETTTSSVGLSWRY